MVELSVELCGIKFKNPIINAAGPLGYDGKTLVKVAKGVAGGLVTKTISVTPAKVPRPNMALIDRGKLLSHMRMSLNGRPIELTKTSIKATSGMLNVELWSDITFKQWIEKEIPIAKTTGLPLIASLGYKAGDMRRMAKKIEKAGVNAIEFSTHYVGIDPKPIVDVAKTLKELVSIPVFAKLSPHTQEISSLAKAVEKAGVDGIVAINSFGPCLHIDIETGKPYLGGENGYGWISGLPIKPLAIRCVAEIAKSVKIPVIGVGGIVSGNDIVEHIMAGASAVQVCTSAIIEGPSIFRRLVSELEEYMKSHKYDSIEDFKGIALKHLPKKPIRTKSIPPKIDIEKCKGCGLCVTPCVYEAIKVEKRPGMRSPKAFIDIEKCYGCGLCVSLCPTMALSF
ncbi:MAG: 4Fe-4S binding protein [Candidatus Bathyarchaeia archaeon]